MLFLMLVFTAVVLLEVRHEVAALIAALSALAVMLLALSGDPALAYY